MADQGSGAGGGAWRSSDFMKWSTCAGSSRHSCIVYLQNQVLQFSYTATEFHECSLCLTGLAEEPRSAGIRFQHFL